MGTDSIIYIRTDGNFKIATGHLVRCLCIAQALESMGKSVCFLVSDTTSSNLLKDIARSFFADYSFSFEVKILHSAVYNNIELELDELKSFLTKVSTTFSSKQTCNTLYHKPVLLIDSYFVTKTYLESLQNYAKTAYIDDLRAFDYKVNLIVNYDVIPLSKEIEYKQAYTKADTLLLGALYTPLRRQFQNQTVSLRADIQNILVTTGGSDPYNFTETVLANLLPCSPHFHFHIVVGKLFKNTVPLENLAKQHPQIHLHYNVSDMASLMKECDYAISAAGTTLYELCALGIPAISFTMADNQIIMAETFDETGAVIYAGDIRTEETSQVCDHIHAHLKSLLLDSEKRAAQHQTMRLQVDGNGAIKIAEAICNL